MVKYLAGFIVGLVVKHLLDKYKKRVAIIKYKITHQSLGIFEKPFELLWRKAPVKNLFSSIIEMKNDSSHDFKDVKINIKGDTNTVFLSDIGFKNEPKNILYWTKEFSGLHSDPKSNVDLIMRNREYLIRVLNRGDKLLFSLSVTTSNGRNPNISVDCDHLGLKLKQAKIQDEFLGIPTVWCQVVGILFSIVAVVPIFFLIESKILAIIAALVVGLVVLAIGALIIKFFYLLLKLFG